MDESCLWQINVSICLATCVPCQQVTCNFSKTKFRASTQIVYSRTCRPIQTNEADQANQSALSIVHLVKKQQINKSQF